MKNLLQKLSLCSVLIVLLLSFTGCNDSSDGFYTKEGKISNGNGDGLKGDDSDSTNPPSVSPGEDDEKDEEDNSADEDKDEDNDEKDGEENNKDEEDNNDDCKDRGEKDKDKGPCPDKISRDKLLDDSFDWKEIACDKHKVAVCVERKLNKKHKQFKLVFIDHHGLQGVLKKNEKSFAINCKDIQPIKRLLKGHHRHEDCNCQ